MSCCSPSISSSNCRAAFYVCYLIRNCCSFHHRRTASWCPSPPRTSSCCNLQFLRRICFLHSSQHRLPRIIFDNSGRVRHRLRRTPRPATRAWVGDSPRVRSRVRSQAEGRPHFASRLWGINACSIFGLLWSCSSVWGWISFFSR